MSEEPILFPSQRICDPHHHLWNDPRQRYLLGEFLAEAQGGHRIESTVYVECLQEYRADGPAHLRPVGEVEFVHQHTENAQASAVRVAAGIIGFADLMLGDDVEEVLLALLAASDRLRGIRYATALDPDKTVFAAHTRPFHRMLGDSMFRRGFQRLRNFDLVFDAWLYFPQLGEVEDLAQEFPDTLIVVNHVGGPIGIGPYAGRRAEVFAEWRQAIQRLGRYQNIHIKLGGLAMKLSGFGWHKRATPSTSKELAQAWKPYFDVCIDSFGATRCMFESNFPMDRVSCSYTVLWNAFKHAVQGSSSAERAALFHETATRVYRLA